MQLTLLQILTTALYFGLLLAYTTVSAGEKNAKRLTIKMILCCLYLFLAISNFILYQSQSAALSYRAFPTARVLIIVLLSFTFIGDFCLARESKKSFLVGSLFFLAANAMLIAAQIISIVKAGLTFGDVWYCLIPFVIFLGFYAWGMYKKVVNFGKLFPLLSVYLTVVTVSGSLGVTLAFSSAGSSLTLLGAGAFLFMISDYCLGIAKFSPRRPAAAQIINSITYFSGIYLIALSVAGWLL